MNIYIYAAGAVQAGNKKIKIKNFTARARRAKKESPAFVKARKGLRPSAFVEGFYIHPPPEPDTTDAYLFLFNQVQKERSAHKGVRPVEPASERAVVMRDVIVVCGCGGAPIAADGFKAEPWPHSSGPRSDAEHQLRGRWPSTINQHFS